MEILLSRLESHVAGSWELKSDLDRLRNSLPRVNDLMDKAEWWRFKNAYISHLLKHLRHAAYDAEDLIAIFDYYELKQKIEGQITNQLLYSLVAFIKNLLCNSTSKIKNIHAKLNSFSKKLEREISQFSSPDEPNPYSKAVQCETSSVIAEQLLGREKEVEMVVKLMLQPGHDLGASSSNNEESLLSSGCAKRRRADSIYVLPIVGIGGVGKTTLAQLIYNDERVKNHFELRIWACVSDFFDLKKVTMSMIESANTESTMGESNNQTQAGVWDNLTSLESLQQTLKQKVESRRCLVVLDDVWQEQYLELESLCKPLRSGLAGSIILITTRLSKIAKLVGTLVPIELDGLPHAIYWDLFKKCAFGSLDPSSFPELEDIGKKIADRLKGSPLAAKTLGGTLRVNLTPRQWRNILNSELWQIKQADGDILPTLRVSYQYLPVHLRRCFHVINLFRKDFNLSLHCLSPVWVADGIVNSEDEGFEYFLDFISRSFFIKDEYGQTLVHDLIHDLAKYLSLGTYYCLKENNWILEKCNGVRHLSVYRNQIDLIDTEIGKYKSIRSLLFFSDFSYEIKLSTPRLALLFNQLQFLRFLHLENCQIDELPENVGNMKLLFYINLSFTRIRSLPDSLCQLYNLQVVNVEGCPIERFPKQFTNLINLRVITEEMEISSIIPGIGKLISLEKLTEFEVLVEDGHKIQELKNMTQLRGHITINRLENVATREDAAQACLCNKKHLTKLTLSWSPGRSTSFQNGDIFIDEDIIEGLEPHPNLESLCIENYMGRSSASWLQTEKLPCLCLLDISECSNLESLQECFVSHQLSSLEKLHLKSCINLNSLPLNCISSSSITELMITDCPKLCCPHNLILPSTLLNLKLDSCGELDKSLPRCLGNVYSLNLLELYNCQHVTSLPSQVVNNLRILKLTKCAELQYIQLSNPFILEELLIVKCPKLVQSDISTVDNETPGEPLKELHKLEIDNTSSLKLSFLRNPPRSLKALVIWGSSQERMFTGDLQGWLNGLDNLEELAFGDCSNLESLPEELHTLVTVKRMEIINCLKIQSLPENGLPPLLNSLYFFGCHPTLTEQLKQQHEANRVRL